MNIQQLETMAGKCVMAFLMSFLLISGANAARSMGSSILGKTANFNKGVEALDSDDFRTALKLFKKEVAEYPENAHAWNYLGFSYRKLENFDQAFEAYETALAIDVTRA